MKKIILERRPSPAMVVATLALFVSLGGVSYGVATGSIDSRELKNNDVRTQDLRNNDVRGVDIRNSTIRGVDVARDTLTGADILESSLGTVPSANTANSARSANTATSAGSASSLSSQQKLSYQAGAGSGQQTIYANGRFTLAASCSAGAVPTVTAKTASANATLHSTGGNPGAVQNDTSPFTADVALSTAAEQRSFVYWESGGQVVVGSYAAVGGAPYGSAGCVVKGLVQTL